MTDGAAVGGAMRPYRGEVGWVNRHQVTLRVTGDATARGRYREQIRRVLGGGELGEPRDERLRAGVARLLALG